MNSFNDLLVHYIGWLTINENNLTSIRIICNRDNYKIIFTYDKSSDYENLFLINLLKIFNFGINDKVYINNKITSLTEICDVGIISTIEVLVFSGIQYRIQDFIDLFKRKTIYGYPSRLFSNFKIKDLKIYFGANTVNQQILYDEKNLIKDNIFENETEYLLFKNENESINIFYLNSDGLLSSKKLSILDFSSDDIKSKLLKYGLKPKIGFIIYILNIDFILESILNFNKFKNILNNELNNFIESNLKKQVNRLNSRIALAKLRETIFYENRALGFSPKNEVETIIFFTNIINSTDIFKKQINSFKFLDYSSVDIDAICEISFNENSPTTVMAVEFEYDLVNFFKHGHDIRQVGLIICFKKSFFENFSYANTNYHIEKFSDKLPILKDNFGNSVKCLIIDEILNAK
jgi:hypothetical protein